MAPKAPLEDVEIPEDTRWAATRAKIHLLTRENVPLCLLKHGHARARPLQRVFAEGETFSQALSIQMVICTECKRAHARQL